MRKPASGGGRAAKGFAAGVLLALAVLRTTPAPPREGSTAPPGAAGRARAGQEKREGALREPLVLSPWRAEETHEAHGGNASALPSRGEPANVDVDARARALLAEHLHLLVAQPLLQQLPYRDRTLGIALASVTSDGEPVLVVAFRGSFDGARKDLRAQLARLHDRGTEYELRYVALR
jgi:hypothetical protein